jgi:hypothetical protein
MEPNLNRTAVRLIRQCMTRSLLARRRSPPPSASMGTGLSRVIEAFSMNCPHCGIAFHDHRGSVEIRKPTNQDKTAWIAEITRCLECRRETIKLVHLVVRNFFRCGFAVRRSWVSRHFHERREIRIYTIPSREPSGRTARWPSVGDRGQRSLEPVRRGRSTGCAALFRYR